MSNFLFLNASFFNVVELAHLSFVEGIQFDAKNVKNCSILAAVESSHFQEMCLLYSMKRFIEIGNTFYVTHKCIEMIQLFAQK